MPTLDTISRAFAGPIPWMYCSAITTRLLVGILTPAIRATCRVLLVTQEKRERRPGPLKPVRPSRSFAEALRYRDRYGAVNNGNAYVCTENAGRKALASPAV